MSQTAQRGQSLEFTALYARQTKGVVIGNRTCETDRLVGLPLADTVELESLSSERHGVRDGLCVGVAKVPYGSQSDGTQPIIGGHLPTFSRITRRCRMVSPEPIGHLRAKVTPMQRSV